LPFPEQRPFCSIDRIRLWQWDMDDVFQGAWPVCRIAAQEVPGLTGRVSAENEQIAAAAKVFMAHVGGDKDDIACVHGEARAAFGLYPL